MAGRVVYPPLFCPVVLSGFAGSSALTINGATQTASFPALSITQTWNSSGVTFTGVRFNITNTASASGSRIFDFQVGGSTRFSGDVNGIFYTREVSFNAGSSQTGNIAGDDTALGLTFGAQSARSMSMLAASLTFAAPFVVQWNSSATDPRVAAAAADLMIGRAAAATLQLGVDVNGAAVSQQLQACNGITGTDRTGGNFTLASGKGTGAGAVSSLIFQTPTVLGSGTTAQSLATRLTLSSAGATFTGGLTAPGGAVFLKTSSALTDGAGASAGTITNAPAVGNPTKWIGINDNGTTRYIPAW